MLTVGATSNSEVVGENSTAFSRFNAGLTDRFKTKIVTPEAPTDWLNLIANLSTNPNQEQINDLNKLWLLKLCLGKDWELVFDI
jgi:hypothetical protein